MHELTNPRARSKANVAAVAVSVDVAVAVDVTLILYDGHSRNTCMQTLQTHYSRENGSLIHSVDCRLVHFAKRFDAEQAFAHATVLNGKNLNLSWHTGTEAGSNGAARGEAVDVNSPGQLAASGDKRKVVART